MTIHKYYIGGMGPYLYDDTEPLLDPDGDFPGEYQNGIITSGTIKAEQAPSENYEVLRFDDLGELIISATRIEETFTSTGTIAKTSNVILANGTYDLFLPLLANGNKRLYEVKNYGTGLISLKPNAAEATKTIDGEVVQVIRPKDSLTVYGDDTNNSWWIL